MFLGPASELVPERLPPKPRRGRKGFRYGLDGGERSRTRSPQLAGEPRLPLYFTRDGSLRLDASSSLPTTCSTSAASMISSIDASRTKPEYAQLSLRERVEIHTRRRIGRAHRLSPAQQDFRIAC